MSARQTVIVAALVVAAVTLTVLNLVGGMRAVGLVRGVPTADAVEADTLAGPVAGGADATPSSAAAAPLPPGPPAARPPGGSDPRSLLAGGEPVVVSCSGTATVGKFAGLSCQIGWSAVNDHQGYGAFSLFRLSLDVAPRPADEHNCGCSAAAAPTVLQPADLLPAPFHRHATEVSIGLVAEMGRSTSHRCCECVVLKDAAQRLPIAVGSAGPARGAAA